MRRAAAAAAIAATLAWAGAGPVLGADRSAPPAMHGSATPSPAPEHSDHSDHSGHDMSDMTEEEMAGMDHGESHEHGGGGHPAGTDGGSHDQHGGTPDTVPSGTRAAVLGGFAAVNAGVLGGALVLRRRDRRPRRGVRTGRTAR